MTEIVWDEVGQRRFETGLDRGVIYPMDGSEAVAWNGLVGVSENRAREVKSFYVDGIKYLDHQVIGAYGAKVQAYMYPEKLDELTGMAKHAEGVFLHDQLPRPFHLSYRTLIGNDMLGTDFGYKIHLIYNVLASPADVAFPTVGERVAPNVFEFNLTATPPPVWGIRPTAHISMHVALDSTGLSAELLQQIEAMLYGTAELDPSFPDLEDLLTLVEGSS